MGGLGLLLIVVGYVVLAVWLIRKTPRWWKLATLAAVLLIPSADALWGRYVTLPEICKDSGLKVYKKVSKQDGLMFDGTAGDEWLTNYRFPFVEGRYLNGEYYRRSLTDGKPTLERNVEPRAQYISNKIHLGEGTRYLGEVFNLRDRHTGELIAKLDNYTFTGGWAERFLGGFADGGPGGAKQCFVDSFPEERMLVAAFE